MFFRSLFTTGFLTLGLIQAQTYYWHRSPGMTGDGEIQKSYNWTTASNGSGGRAPGAKDDTWDAANLNTAVWTGLDATLDSVPATYSMNGTSLTLRGAGRDTWVNFNQFVAFYRSDIQGNFDVTVVVSGLDSTHEWAKAGLITANDLTDLSLGGYAAMAITPGHGAQFLADAAAPQGELDSSEESPVTGQLRLRLIKSGNMYSGYWRVSTANQWNQVGTTTAVLGAGANAQIGIFVCSHNASTATAATFDDFQGGGDLSSNNLDLRFTGTSPTSDANARIVSAFRARSVDFTGYSGTLTWGSSTLTLTGNATFASTMTLNAGTGTLALIADTGSQTLTGSTLTLNAVSHTGAGTLRLGDGQRFVVKGGFLQVLDNQVRVVTEQASRG